MKAERLEVGVRGEADAAVLVLSGEVNALAERSLEAAYELAIASRPRVVILDFAGVTYMNSAGIALVVGLLAKARQFGQRMAACRLNPHYAEIFEITRLADYLAVYPDVDAAIAADPSAQAP